MESNNENAHLHIETVTPDTEKDGQANDQKYNHRVDNEASKEADERSEADKPEGEDNKEPYALYEKTEDNKEEEPAISEDKDSEEENKNDSASDIETVAP